MYLLRCEKEEEEAIAAAICKENCEEGKCEWIWGVPGCSGAKVEKVIAVEAGTCSADTAEQQVITHDKTQLSFHANMGFTKTSGNPQNNDKLINIKGPIFSSYFLIQGSSRAALRDNYLKK